MNWAQALSHVFPAKNGEANIYGVILYTDSHPHVVKLLRDDEYWNALHEISGPRWTVFAVRAVPGRTRLQGGGPGQLGMMVAVWDEPRANKELLEHFKIKSTKHLPLLVVFAEDVDGEVSQTTLRIRGRNEEELFLSVKGVFETTANALRLVSIKNLQEGTRAYHAVGYALKDHKEKQLLKRTVKFWQWLRSVSP